VALCCVDLRTARELRGTAADRFSPARVQHETRGEVVLMQSATEERTTTGVMHSGSIDSKTASEGRVFRAMYAERRVIDPNGKVIREGGYFRPSEIRHLCEPCEGECYAASTIVSSIRKQLERRTDNAGKSILVVPEAEWRGRTTFYRLIEYQQLQEPEVHAGAHFAETPLW